MISGDLVTFKWIEDGFLILLSEFKQVDEPAWTCLNLKNFNIEWFYEFDLKFVDSTFISKEHRSNI